MASHQTSGNAANQHTAAAGRRNGAAVLSLICAVLWPLTVLVPAIFNLVTRGPRLPGATLPQFLVTLMQVGFALLPIAGVIAGIVGLYRAWTQPAIQSSRWQAVVGLVLGCLWIIGIFTFSFAGLELLHWFRSL
jgi:hypothetical protein